ncbi:hypothetical protein B7494_g4193 [Chlorociboria aeruginascens]|nr:hypothetical protein B7494_g4193 [Chlorociboria aeruginascens]
MPGLLLEKEPEIVPLPPKVPEYGFVVFHQSVELDIDFTTQSLTGRVEITILPQSKDLRTIKLDARQCTIPQNKVLVNGAAATHTYEDRFKGLEIPEYFHWAAEQHEMQKGRLKPLLDDTRGNGDLVITLPENFRVEEVDPFSESAASALAQRAVGAVARIQSIIGEASGVVGTPKTAVEQSVRFQPLVISIPFAITKFREGLHFVGLKEGDARFPHVYTKHHMDPGVASCIFPCVDDPAMRCTWELSIRCSRTLEDALKRHSAKDAKTMQQSKKTQFHGIVKGSQEVEEYEFPLNNDEKLLEMVVVCSGDQTNEDIDLDDSTKKIVKFTCGTEVAAQHIGFAVGPFEQVDLAEFREDEDDEKLGSAQSVPIFGYCLPGRAQELRNTCLPMAHAIDWFSLKFGSFPFPFGYKMVFIDDQISDVEHTASLSLCSTRLLFPEAILDPLEDNYRILAHAVASQWIGVNIIPSQKADRWVVVGLSHYMTALFMKALFGNNEFAFRQKVLADRLVELDINRPSLHSLGETLHLGSFEYDFMALKASLVLFILDKRIMKAQGSTGMDRVITKLFFAANTNSETVLSTESFRKSCERYTKYRATEPFWNQWILNAGCPRFSVAQKMNKKRLCVEMTISQKQDTLPTQRTLEKGSFLREFKEEINGVYAGEIQPVFQGPLTIRIHEADGTPYEHIVELREGVGRFEIPYNTKYKRLKRSRRAKERANATAGADIIGDNHEDVLIYCLGDVLQSQDEVREWGLQDWDAETETRMDLESYEWIRIDSDFEWVCEKSFLSMPSYMYVSQLQQDRDVVAQQESMMFLKAMPAHPLAATFLIRTLDDRRYFHGIRTMAAECLAKQATVETNWLGMKQLEKEFHKLFSYEGDVVPRPNDFSDRQSYKIECIIPEAMAKIRDPYGKCPRHARQFILDLLNFNDNEANDYSDNFKVARLLTALTESLLPVKASRNELHFGDDDEDDEPKQFLISVIEALDRYGRMDEWIESYHNIYTVTVLECKKRLMKAGVIPINPLEFAQHLHGGTSDEVRLKAFEAFSDLGLLKNGAISSLLLNVLSTDPSPYVRKRLFEIFCSGLAIIAFGENKMAEATTTAIEPDTLIIEQEASLEARKAHIARTTTIDGALTALREELQGDPKLKDALWKAVSSPLITLSEQTDLLDICWILYEPKDCMLITMQYPRYWAAENLGKGQIVFRRTEKVRTIPRKKLKTTKAISAPNPMPVPPTVAPIRLAVPGAMKPPKRPHPQEGPQTSKLDGQPLKKKILTLKLHNKAKLEEITKSPPNPTQVRGKSASYQGSPAPKASPAPKSSLKVSASPTPQKPPESPVPAAVPAAGPAVVKARKPLPESRKPLPDSAPNPATKKPSIVLKLKTNKLPSKSSPSL